MNFKALIVLFVPVLIALVGCAPAPEPPQATTPYTAPDAIQSPLEAGPEGIQAVVRIGSLDALEANVDSFLRAAIQIGAPGFVEAYLLNEIGIADRTGVSGALPLWLFVIEAEGGASDNVWLLPMTDQGEFLTRIGARRMGMEPIYEHQETIIVPNESTAVILPKENADALLAWAQSDFLAVLNAYRQTVDTSATAGRMNASGMFETIEIWVDEFDWLTEQGYALPPMPSASVQTTQVDYTAPLRASAMAALRDGLADVETLHIVPAFTQFGFAVNANMTAEEGSSLDAYLARMIDEPSAIPVRGGGLRGSNFRFEAPDAQRYSLLEQTNTSTLFPLPEVMLNRMLGDLETLGANATQIKLARSGLTTVLNGRVASLQLLPPGEQEVERLAWLGLQDGADFETWLDAVLDQAPRALSGLMSADGYRVEIKHSEATDSDGRINRIEFEVMQGDATSPPPQELIDAFPAIEYASLDGGVVFSTTSLSPILETLRVPTAMEGQPDGPLNQGGILQMEYGLGGLVASMLQAATGQQNLPISSYINSETITVSLYARESSLQASLSLPTSAIQTVFQQMLMEGVFPLSGMGQQ